MKLCALLTWVHGLALKSLSGLAGVACGTRDCADKELGMEGEGVWTLGASLYLQRTDAITDMATQLA